MTRVLLMAVLALFAGGAAASDGALDLGGRAGFDAQREQVLTDLADGETYAEISAEDRAQVLQALDRMERILAGRQPGAVRPDERAALLTEQEKVNVILTGARRDSRLVCTRERPVGTRMPTTVCRTVAERRRMTDDARQRMEAAGRGRANTIL